MTKKDEKLVWGFDKKKCSHGHEVWATVHCKKCFDEFMETLIRGERNKILSTMRRIVQEMRVVADDRRFLGSLFKAGYNSACNEILDKLKEMEGEG